MSYEAIDESSANDAFIDIKNKILVFSEAKSPDIKDRIEIEKKLKLYLKAPKPELVLNFIIECINAVNGQKSKEKIT